MARSKKRPAAAADRGRAKLDNHQHSNDSNAGGKAEFNARWLAFHRAAAGAFEVLIVTPQLGEALLAAAAAGEPKAGGILRAIAEYGRRFHDKPRGEGGLCLDCATEFPADEVPLTFTIWLPAFAPAPTMS